MPAAGEAAFRPSRRSGALRISPLDLLSLPEFKYAT
jgi:hypothetical protein